MVSAARTGDVTAWTKRRSGWGQAGIGGEAWSLFSDGPPPRWFDVVEMADQGRYLMVYSDGFGGSWTYLVRTSTNGLTWSAPTRIDVPTGGDEALYLSLSSPDLASQRRVVGDTVWLFRTRTAMRGWDRWLGEIGIDRIALTATGS